MTSEINHDADVQAVVALMDAAGAMPMDEFNASPLAAAINALYAQFEDRIDEADKRNRECAGEALKQARWQYGRKDRERCRTFVNGDGEEI